MRATVQLSLDFTDLDEALRTAEIALGAGIDWLEVGTPLVIAAGTRAIRELRARYPDVPIVADLKMMDGGWLETKLAAQAGANMVVVMGQAHEETVEEAVRAGREFGAHVMGDNMAMPDPVAGARRLEELGCEFIVHHIGYDMRNVRAARELHPPTPLVRLRELVEAVSVPVQAVGGLTLEQAVETPSFGAPLVVIGAPLANDAYAGRAGSDFDQLLRSICEKVHAYGDVKIGRAVHV